MSESEEVILEETKTKQKSKELPLFELLYNDVLKPELISGYYHIPIYLNKVKQLISYLNDNEKSFKRVDDINGIKSITLTSGERVLVPTGIKVNIDSKKIYSTTIPELLLTKHLFCTTYIENNQLMLIIINNSRNKVRLENNDKCVLFSLI